MRGPARAARKTPARAVRQTPARVARQTNLATGVDRATSDAAPASPKRQALEKAAAAVFLRDGYAGASVDEIAREAGVSKATLYSYFRSKEALFGAIICQQCGRFVVEAQTADAAHADPAQVLRNLGRGFLENLLSPYMLALYRVVAGEAHRFPELGRTIYQAGPGPARAALADYFRDLTRKGRLTVEQPEIAADQFFGTLLGGIHLRQILGVERPPSGRMIESWVDHAVTALLAAHAPR